MSCHFSHPKDDRKLWQDHLTRSYVSVTLSVHDTKEIEAMKNKLSYRVTLTICAVALILVSIMMHIDPAHVSGSEFPDAQGDVHNIYRVIASLLFVVASITFFAGRVEDTKSQQLVLNGCILGFAVMFITLGTMTVTELANITGGTIVFAVLTALCVYTRVRTKSD